MATSRTALNAIGTAAGIASLLSGRKSQSNSKINNFQAELRKAGVARTNLFEVVISAPSVITGSRTAQKLSLYAEGAQLPGMQINTGDLKRYGVGPSEKIPYAMSFNDITLQFIGDGQGEIYKFFYNWMQGIVRGDADALLHESTIDKNFKSAFEVEFKEKYAVDILIYTFNEQGDIVLESKLTRAFPINVPDISLSWSDGSFMQFSVTFSYFQAQLANAEASIKTSKGTIKELSTFQKAVKIATAVQTIATLKKPTSIQGAISSAATVKNVAGGF